MAEIVLVIGYNGGGKTTFTEKNFPTYHRINRDSLGGKLKDLPEVLDKVLTKGPTDVVMDNTYADVESRKGVIECAKKHNVPIRCVWLTTSFEDAQYNACLRQIRKHGRLCTVEEMKSGKDPNMFPPVAIFGYRTRFQEPTVKEGFVSVEEVPFVRYDDPSYTQKALILDYDDTLRDREGGGFPRAVSEIRLLPGRTEKLQEYKDKGYILLGVSNQSGVHKGTITHQDAVDCFEHTNKLVGHEIEYHFCPHRSQPIECFCRKPHSGRGVYLIEKHKLNRHESIFVGDQTTDKTFAARCGFQYFHPDSFFRN